MTIMNQRHSRSALSSDSVDGRPPFRDQIVHGARLWILLVAGHGLLVHLDLVCREVVEEMVRHDSGSICLEREPLWRHGGLPRAALSELYQPHIYLETANNKQSFEPT